MKENVLIFLIYCLFLNYISNTRLEKADVTNILSELDNYDDLSLSDICSNLKECMFKSEKEFVEFVKEFFKKNSKKNIIKEPLFLETKQLKQNIPIPNSQSSQQILFTSHFGNIKKPRIIYLIHISTLNDFFKNFIKGFQSIQGSGRKIIKNGKIFIVQENLSAFFVCHHLHKGIGHNNFDVLKMALQELNINNFKNGLTKIIRSLRNIIISVGNKCKGIEDILEITNSVVIKMKEEGDQNKNQLREVNNLRQKALEFIDTNSFADLGLILGEIVGQAKKFPTLT
jgi:hypothetical protein